MIQNSPFLFQVIGYSNSGKTTLVSKWIKKLSLTQKRVATIKHHGHSDILSPLDQGKDSSHHRIAGALSTFVSSPNEVQWQMKTEDPLSLKQILGMHESYDFDVLIIEGYKKEDFSKILLLRCEDDISLLEKCSRVEAVICWRFEDIEKVRSKYKIPVFHLTQEDEYLDWLMNQVDAGEGAI